MTTYARISFVWRTTGSPFDRFVTWLAGGSRRWWRGVLVVAAVAWVPLVVSAALTSTHAVRGSIEGLDLSTLMRFLVALPVALLAQPFVDHRLSFSIFQLRGEGIVRPQDQEHLVTAVERLRRRRESPWSELFLAILAYTIVRTTAIRTADAQTVFWLDYVSFPLLWFVLLRWCYRLINWFLFLVEFSRMNLQLLTTHPDRAGGLGVIALAHSSLGLVAVAFSTAFSAGARERILRGELSIEWLSYAFALYAVCLAFVLLGPLVALAPALIRARRRALITYGRLAQRYAREFDLKWIASPETSRRELLGMPDVEPLANLQSAYEVIRKMSPIPIDRSTLVAIAIGAVAPVFPALATVIPLGPLFRAILRTFT